jgi:tetratricopeptide (TPR) repeat protein/nitrogen-specific signal transduction histidine kinase
MNRPIFLLLLFLIHENDIVAQKNDRKYIDSAITQLSIVREDTNKVKLLFAISSKYSFINADSGIIHGKSGLALATKLDWKKEIVKANICLGLNYASKSEYKTALDYYFAGLKINEEVKDKRLQAVLTRNIGTVYHDLGFIEKALEFQLKTLDILKDANNEPEIANVYENIALVYYTKGNHLLALDYHFRALKIDEAYRDTSAIAIVYGNIGNVHYSLKNNTKALEYYFKAAAFAEKIKNKSFAANAMNNIAAVYEVEGKYEDAVKYYYQARKAYVAVGYNVGVAITTGNIGRLLGKRGDYSLAIHFEQEALKIAEETGSKETIALQLLFIGATYLMIAEDTVKIQAVHFDLPAELNIYTKAIPPDKNANLLKAIEYLERASKMEEDIHHLERMKSCYEQLAKAYQLTGNFKKAIKYLNNYKAINDSVFSKDKQTALNQIGMEKEYDIALMKERMNADAIKRANELKLDKQREYLFLSFGGIVMLIGVSTIVIRNNRIQRRLHSTIQKMTERELAQSESNLRSIFDNTEMMYLLLNTSYHVVAYNQRMRDVYLEVAGHQINIGDNLGEMLLPEKKKQVTELYDSVVANKKSIMYETAYVLKNGTKYFMAQVTPISGNDNVSGICISSAEITKMKELEFERQKIIDDLLQRNNDLLQFAHIVSHNVRGPLSTIMSLNSIIQHDLPEDELKMLHEGIKVSSEKLDIVIKDLNQILQVRRELSEAKVVVKFSEISFDVIASISLLIKNSNAIIEEDFSEVNEMFTVRSYLNSIFYNLLTNALKFKRPGIRPHIKIWSELRNGKINIYFRDNGLGVDMKVNKYKVFMLYQRFNPDIEGKGLGLFMTKTQVEVLNGKIDVESELGTGATFHLIFPGQS